MNDPAHSCAMARLTIRIEFENGLALGPGKVRLLEHIDKAGSIRAAAIAMGMSYRRAWLLIHDVEAMVGVPAIKAETGGARGGGTTLTPAGHELVRRYWALLKGVETFMAPELRALSRMTRPTKNRRSTARRK